MVCRWLQELLGYPFTIIQRSNKMMVNLYALTRRFGHITSHHIAIFALLKSCDQSKRPRAYAPTKFRNLSNVNIRETDIHSRDSTSFLTSNVLHHFSQDMTTNSVTDSSLYPSLSTSIITLPIQMSPSPNLCTISPLHESVTPNTAMTTLNIPQCLEI